VRSRGPVTPADVFVGSSIAHGSFGRIWIYSSALGVELLRTEMSLVTHFVAQKARRSGFLNFSEGFRLLRSREVPSRVKLLALSLGLLVTLLLEALEVPLESVLAVFVPILGGVMDLAFDGAEFLILPLLFAALIVQRLRIRQ
jgi:hypothetical protein